MKLKSLIELKTDLNVKNSNGKTILFDLCSKEKLVEKELLKELIQSNANPNVKYQSLMKTLEDNNTPLLQLISLENPESEKIKILLENRADPNCSNRFNVTPFHQFCRTGEENEKVLRVFLEHKARLNSCDRYQITPLIDLIKRKHYSSFLVCILGKENPFGIATQEVICFSQILI